MDELKRMLMARLGISDPDKLPLTLDIPIAGDLAGWSRAASYRSKSAMPIMEAGGRQKVLTLPWLRILAGEAN
jgi:hypothetical protein